QGNLGWESAAAGRGVWRAARDGAGLGGCRRSGGDRGAGADGGTSGEASRPWTGEGRKPRIPLAHSHEVFAKTASGVNALGVRGSQPTAGLGETGEVQTAKPAVVPEQSSGTKSLHSEFLPEPETRRARPCAHARFMLRPAPASGTPGLQSLSNGAGPESRRFLVFPATQRQSDFGCGAHRPRNQMSRDICVQTWPCSYYLELEKRWVPGRLSLTSLSLKFMTDKTREILVSFPLSSIIEIKKEASHFIFSSITILERDHNKHWFSSLQPSRNAVFSIIEHFWRELLLSPSGAAAEASSSSVTKGKELTYLMACTQKRLEDTARVLHHQGEQLDSISRGLDKMESDLDALNNYSLKTYNDKSMSSVRFIRSVMSDSLRPHGLQHARLLSPPVAVSKHYVEKGFVLELQGMGPSMGLQSQTRLSDSHFLTSPSLGFPGGTSGKEPSCQCRRHKKHVFDP
ncbi:hypothetical protein FD755_000471, partial [Muntiacus reevesi]